MANGKEFRKWRAQVLRQQHQSHVLSPQAVTLAATAAEDAATYFVGRRNAQAAHLAVDWRIIGKTLLLVVDRDFTRAHVQTDDPFWTVGQFCRIMCNALFGGLAYWNAATVLRARDCFVKVVARV